MDAAKKAKQADHAHQDPRSGNRAHDPHQRGHAPGPRADSAAIKTRGVPRMNNVINWFRKAPKHKGD